MKHLEELKKKIDRELEDLSKKDLSMATLEKMHIMTDTMKNIDKICMLEEEMGEGGYSEARGGRSRGGRSSYDMGGSSYGDEEMMYSERRGRGRNARRDSMGQYAYDGGYSEEGYSEEGGSSYRGGSSSYRGGQGGGRGGYSRDEAKDHMMHKLGEMMSGADLKTKKILEKCMMELDD